MLYTYLIISAAVGMFVSWLLIGIVRKAALHRAQDRTGQFHHQPQLAPISRFGGIGFAGAFGVTALVAGLLLPGDIVGHSEYLVIVLSTLAMFGVGLWDDFRPLGAKRKLLFQILIASAVYAFGIQIEQIKNPFTGNTFYLGGFGFFATVFWLVAITNLMNLIDGIDGLAGGIGLMLMCLLATFSLGSTTLFPALLATGVAGALLAFLRFNFPPAKIYMGDGGAYFLGFLIGLLTIQTSHKGTVAAALIAPVFALALPIIDTSMAIVRRGILGLPIFRADQGHIHHRLARLGFSRRRTVLLLYCFCLIFLALAFGVFWMEGRFLPMWIGIACLAVVIPAHRWGLLPTPRTVGSMLRDTSQLRKEGLYALALAKWFELEGERCKTIVELWNNYQFVARKLGFTQVKLLLEDRGEVWTDAKHEQSTMWQHRRHELIGGQSITIEFAADSNLSPALFEHLSGLAAEMWLKSALRWRETRQSPIRFEPQEQSVAPNKDNAQIIGRASGRSASLRSRASQDFRR